MLFGGKQPLTLIDYPKKLATILFTQGCHFRCHYCHNSELVIPQKYQKSLSEKEILDFLKSRIGKLDAVVISGGEPTVQPDLSLFIKKVKELGYLVKLDTSGINPHKILLLIKSNFIDYIAMDIKAPLEKYPKVIGRKLDIEKIKRSIKIILSSSISYEFRSTLVECLHSTQDVIDIAKAIKGANLLALQKFVSTSTLNPHYRKENPFSDAILENLKIEAEKYVKKCIIR